MNRRAVAVGMLMILAFTTMVTPSVAFAAPEEEEKSTWDKVVDWFTGDDEEENQKEREGYAQASISGDAGDLLIDNIVPAEDQQSKVGNVTVTPFLYSPSRYQLDIWIDEGIGFSDDAASTWHGFNNGLWSANTTFAYVIYWLLDTFQSVNIINDMAKDLENGVQTLAGFNGSNLQEGQGVWGMLLPIVLMLAGGYIGYQALGRNDEMSAKKAAIQSLLIIFFAFAYMNYASAVISTPANIVMAMRNGIMGLGASVTDGEIHTPEEATAASINNLHKVMIENDWKMLQWGHTEVDQRRVDTIIRHPQDSDIRKTAVEREAKPEAEGGLGNKNMSSEANFIRFGFIIGSLLKNLFIGFIVGAMAVAGWLFQVVYLFLALIAPLALIWAVNPKWIESAENWAAEVLGALMMMFAVGMVLTVYFIGSDLLYDWAADDGFLKIVISQIGFIIVLIWKRDTIFRIAAAPASFAVARFDADADVMGKMMSAASRWFRMRNHYQRQRDGFKKAMQDAKGSGPDAPDEGNRIDPEVVEAEPVTASLKEETRFERYDQKGVGSEERASLSESTGDETFTPDGQDTTPAASLRLVDRIEEPNQEQETERIPASETPERTRPSSSRKPEKNQTSSDEIISRQDAGHELPSLRSMLKEDAANE